MSFYKVVRFYMSTGKKRVIKRGLSEEAAKRHCKDPETNSKTAQGYVAKRRTKRYGEWFDGFEEER